MIRIEKGPAPDFLTDPNGLWCKETEKAIAYYSSSTDKPAFKFKMYNHDRVKEALRGIFVKCAYCESKYASSSDGDIEHFRPKGRVEGKQPPTPGYYWLANDWTNLLLSCQHCNQGRKHKLYDQQEGEGEAKIGKLDRFPLAAPGQWAKSHVDPLENEEPHRLLLNPCTDFPEDHFDYHETEALMIPKNRKAEVSIDIYSLRRRFLVQERKELLSSILSQLELLKNCLENYNEQPSERNKDAVRLNWQLVAGFTAKQASYTGMARFFVKRFLVNNRLSVPTGV